MSKAKARGKQSREQAGRNEGERSRCVAISGRYANNSVMVISGHLYQEWY